MAMALPLMEDHVVPLVPEVDLPVVRKTKIFSFFRDYEKIGTRFICKHWEKRYSNLLEKKSYFYLSSDKSDAELLESNINWSPFGEEYAETGLPPGFETFITTVHLRFSGLTGFKDSVKFLIRLPELKNLVLEMSPREEEYVNMHLKLSEKFKGIVSKLKKLFVTFINIGPLPMKTFLNAFEVESMELTHLQIVEDADEEEEADDENLTCVRQSLKQILGIISKSKHTLISLNLDFLPKSMLTDYLFTQLVEPLTSLKDLKLETVLIWFHMIEDVNQFSSDIYQNFLKEQIKRNPEIKRISLPWCGNSVASVYEEFLSQLPKSLEFIGSLRAEHMYATDLSKLNSISISSEREDAVFADPLPNIQQLDVILKESIDLAKEDNFYELVGQSLINLVRLYIHGFHDVGEMVPFNDDDLQLIIKNFKQLRDLRIVRCPEITETGITGIAEIYVDELVETQQLYQYPQIPATHVIGLSLSSLKFLEKLELCMGKLTDLGIHYGLRFGLQMKEMTIHGHRVTREGLTSIVIGNPNLEAFDGFFISELPLNGEYLRNLLIKIISTGQFRFKNVLESQSEDEVGDSGTDESVEDEEGEEDEEDEEDDYGC